MLIFFFLPLPINAQETLDYDLTFSTYIGGSESEYSRDIEVDSQGNVYVAGTTSSPDFPVTTGAYDTSFDTSNGRHTVYGDYYAEIFVMKFSPNGQLIWSTFIGGPWQEEAYGLEVDAGGYVYVHGRGALGSPTTAGVYQEDYNSLTPTLGETKFGGHKNYHNAYIAKLSPDGSNLVWASFFGDCPAHRDIDIDASGDIYATFGEMPESERPDPDWWANPPFSDWFTGTYRPTPGPGQEAGVAKIASDGSQVDWATFLGGNGDDGSIGSVGVDANGYVHVGFSTNSTGIATPGAFDETFNGGVDWFVTRLSPYGRNMVYGTYIGDSGNNWINTHNLTVDPQGNVYTSTCAWNSGFPTTPGAFDRTANGGVDWGIVKLDPAGGLVAGTLLGGSAGDNPDGIRLDPAGNVFLSGQSSSANFPVTPNAYQGQKNGGNDAVIVMLSADLTHLLYSTFIGGSSDDDGRDGALGQDGSLHISGAVRSQDWPTLNAYQSSLGGSQDTMLAKLSLATSPTLTPNPTPTPIPGDVDNDGDVDLDDMLQVLATWITSSQPEDINGDGKVNAADMVVVIANFGTGS